MLRPKSYPALILPRAGEEETSSSMLDPDMLAVAKFLRSEMYGRESRGVCDFEDRARLFITRSEKEEEDKDKARRGRERKRERE